MNAQEVDLYERIKAFSLDQADAQLSFSRRLARDNGWSLEYAGRVIEEYKKFAFLAVTAGHSVTPSDQVDQVWHLHLTYTRSYWEEFCSQVLQMPLHHDPTCDGQAENQKFAHWYNKTLESYEQFFGQTPPVEIWSIPENRFGRDLHFVRVNTQQNWVLPKLGISNRATACVTVLLTLILSGCYIVNSESKISPLAGILLIVICLGAVFGVIQFLVGIVSWIKNPSVPRISSGLTDGSFAGGGDFGGDSGSSDSSCDGGYGGGCGGDCGGG